MRKLTSISMVVCGILVVAGIFLPWTNDASAWDGINNAGVDDAFGALLVLIGGVIIIICSGLVLLGKGNLRTLRMLEVVALVGATLAAGLTLGELIPDTIGDTSTFINVDYGLYIATAGAVIGVIVGALAATRVTKKKVQAE